MKKLYVLLLCAVLLAVYACKKGSNNGSINDPTPNLLTSASWQQTKVEWQTTAGVWVTRTSYSDSPFSKNTDVFRQWHLFAPWRQGRDVEVVDRQEPAHHSYQRWRKLDSLNVATLTSTTLQLTIPLTGEYTITYNPYVMTNYTTERDTYSH